MSKQNNIIQEIHSKALQAAQSFKKAESDLLNILQEAERHRIFFHFDCKSLFEYTVNILKLSESTASNFITVARKAREVPALKKAIENGDIGISKARKITPILNSQNQSLWLEKATHLSSRKLEEEVARVMPKLATPEKIKFVSDDRVNVNFGFSKDMKEKLRRVQDLESQRTKKSATLEETMGAALEAYLEKYDPIRKAERSKLHVTGHTGRLNAATKHEVNKRDDSQCTFINSQGIRCSEKRWIDIHHVIPRHAGGSNSPENLKLLCSGHHRMLHANASRATWTLEPVAQRF